MMRKVLAVFLAAMLALLSLGVQFPDEKTRIFCKKFSRDPAPRLATAAERVTESINALLDKSETKTKTTASESTGAAAAEQP